MARVAVSRDILTCFCSVQGLGVSARRRFAVHAFVREGRAATAVTLRPPQSLARLTQDHIALEWRPHLLAVSGAFTRTVWVHDPEVQPAAVVCMLAR